MRRVLPFLMVAVIAPACQPVTCDPSVPCAPTSPKAVIEIPFVLKPGDTAQIDGTPLRVTFQGVASDSRCPTKAFIQCVSAGSANVTIVVRDAEKERWNGVLETNGRTSAVTIDAYQITLVGVTPEMETTSPIPSDDYRVTLKVHAL